MADQAFDCQHRKDRAGESHICSVAWRSAPRIQSLFIIVVAGNGSENDRRSKQQVIYYPLHSQLVFIGKSAARCPGAGCLQCTLFDPYTDKYPVPDREQLTGGHPASPSFLYDKLI